MFGWMTRLGRRVADEVAGAAETARAGLLPDADDLDRRLAIVRHRRMALEIRARVAEGADRRAADRRRHDRREQIAS